MIFDITLTLRNKLDIKSMSNYDIVNDVGNRIRSRFLKVARALSAYIVDDNELAYNQVRPDAVAKKVEHNEWLTKLDKKCQEAATACATEWIEEHNFRCDDEKCKSLGWPKMKRSKIDRGRIQCFKVHDLCNVIEKTFTHRGYDSKKNVKLSDECPRAKSL